MGKGRALDINPRTVSAARDDSLQSKGRSDRAYVRDRRGRNASTELNSEHPRGREHLHLTIQIIFKMSPVSDESHPDRRKRRRKALSCLECRRRKVKCDRNVPRCNRCLETGDAVNCVYTSVAQNLRDHEDGESQASGEENDHLRGRNFNGGTLNTPASTATASHDAAEDVSFSLREQARKIAQLESRLASLESPQLQVSDHVQPRVVAGIKRKNNSKSPDRNSRDKPQEIVFLRGKCFKTVFQGASCPISSLADVSFLIA